jgi:hypothetical protein
MGFMWSMTVDDYCNIYDICVKLGIKPGESMEIVVAEYMKAKGVKPSMTDLTKDELIEQLAKDKKILSIETDEDGEQDIRFIEKDKDV